MATLVTMEKELRALRAEVQDLKRLLREDFELSPSAKRALARARKTPESTYVDLV